MGRGEDMRRSLPQVGDDDQLPHRTQGTATTLALCCTCLDGMKSALNHDLDWTYTEDLFISIRLQHRSREFDSIHSIATNAITTGYCTVTQPIQHRQLHRPECEVSLLEILV